MLSFFKTLTNHVVTVELKNDIRIRGTLKSVDQYLNIKLDDIDVLDLDKYPHLSSVKNMFIRGSVVRYVVLPQAEVDRGLLEDATRRGEPDKTPNRPISFVLLLFLVLLQWILFVWHVFCFVELWNTYELRISFVYRSFLLPFPSADFGAPRRGCQPSKQGSMSVGLRFAIF